MRIAYLINQYPKVSHTFIRREIQALERQGHEILRIALRGWHGELVDEDDEKERELTRYVLKDGVPVLLASLLRIAVMHPLKLMATIRLALQMSRSAERPLPVHLVYVLEACRIILLLRKESIEHLHAHFGTNSAEVAMLVNTLGGPKWSFTVHGPEEFDKHSLIGLAKKVECCDFVAAISSFGRAQLYRLAASRKREKVHVVHCGLDPGYYAGEISLPPSARRLVCVGRLCDNKGQLLLVEAARRILSKGKHFELVLAGDGEVRKDIEAIIERDHLQSNVRITGWISGGQVRDEILASRALVLPSFAEGLPVAIMEAMALGRPVISTYIAGIPELVQEQRHGWLIPAGDLDSLISAIEACLDAPTEQLAIMGAAGRQRVLARHDVNIEAKKLSDLFTAAAVTASN